MKNHRTIFPLVIHLHQEMSIVLLSTHLNGEGDYLIFGTIFLWHVSLSFVVFVPLEGIWRDFVLVTCMYVHVATFLLLCVSPFWIFNVATINIDDEPVRIVLRLIGIFLCVFGLLYGGYWMEDSNEGKI